MATGAAPASPPGRRLVGRVALLGAVVFLAVPASALASQRFASPNGAGGCLEKRAARGGG